MLGLQEEDAEYYLPLPLNSRTTHSFHRQAQHPDEFTGIKNVVGAAPLATEV